MAKGASDHVADPDLEGLDTALEATRQLPASLQLAAFLQLIDKTILNNSPDRPSGRDHHFRIFKSISYAAVDLNPVIVSSCTPNL